MSLQPSDDLSSFSMLELFRVEVESQVAALTAGLLEVERDPTAAKPLEALKAVIDKGHELVEDALRQKRAGTVE